MVTLEITLPEEMLIFVEAQAAAKGLGGVSEFVQSLIADARRAAEQVEFEVRFRAALRAIEEGSPNPLSPEDWRRLSESRLGGQASQAGS